MTTLALTTDVDGALEVDLDLAGVITIIPTPNLPPDPGKRWRRVSLVFPAPTIDPDTGHPVDWLADPDLSVDVPWGRLQVVVDGRDVSQFRDIPTLVKGWTIDEPGGDVLATVVFPAITPHDHPGSGAVAWLHDGAHVGINRIRDDGTTKHLWTGLLDAETSDYDETSQTYTVSCIGALYQADYGIQLAGFDTSEREIGKVVPDALNTYISRDYLTCPRISTPGVTTRKRGSGTPRLTGYIFELLADATTSDGLDQWTLHNFGWAPRLLLKDRTNIHATMRAGQAGLKVSLQRGVMSAPKVIFGEGTRVDGMRWRNTKYPNRRLDDAPLFPLDPGDSFTPGGADTGFGPFAVEMREAGYTMHSVDTYDSRDETEVLDAQTRAGVAIVDGNVGANTWAAIFGVGADVGTDAGAYQAPISAIHEVEPWLYDARGKIIGKNPDYDPNIPRIERYEQMGEGIDLAHGRSSARGELNRTNLPVWYGTVTLAADPNEMSRWELRAGHNFLLQGHHGIDRQLHIARVQADWEQQTVTLTVDQANRDLLTLMALIARNKESSTDPLRRMKMTPRRSRELADTITPWDGEAGAGRNPYHAIAAGQWLVHPIPAGQAGTITRIRMTTSGPASEFVIGIFGQPVTAAQLQHLIGDPLTSSKPFATSYDALVDLGIVVAWGGQDTPAGYSPGAKTDDGAVLNGKLIDDGGFSYSTVKPGWLWIAEWVADSCYIEGQLTAGVEGL